MVYLLHVQHVVHCLVTIMFLVQVEWGILNLAGAKVQHTEANKSAPVCYIMARSLSFYHYLIHGINGQQYKIMQPLYLYYLCLITIPPSLPPFLPPLSSSLPPSLPEHLFHLQ